MIDKNLFLIGIAGGSCSGKSFLAEKLEQAMGEDCIGVISLDRYYHDLKPMPPERREEVNFDRPDAIDFGMLEEDIARLAAGEEIRLPIYDFRTHTRRPEDEWTETVAGSRSDSAPVLILEGLHTFYTRGLRDLLDLRVYIDTSPDVCLARRLKRDVRERGRTGGSVRDVFEKNVMPMYRKFVLPTREYSDIVLNGEGDYRVNVSKVLDKVQGCS
ncbi:MAG: uridine kinase [Candidatus Latescibacteria bacterium]|nr:uridine kinase [bacterium]MBD3423215.1 uridine kinase [Candidatus Latescibacterota bacterium]